MHEVSGTIFHRWYVTIFGLAFAYFAVRHLGWRRTVALCGGLGCTVSTLLLYYAPHLFGANFPLAALAGIRAAVPAAVSAPAVRNPTTRQPAG